MEPLTAQILVTIIASLVILVITGVFGYVPFYFEVNYMLCQAWRWRAYGQLVIIIIAILMWVVGYGGIIHGFVHCMQKVWG